MKEPLPPDEQIKVWYQVWRKFPGSPRVRSMAEERLAKLGYNVIEGKLIHRPAPSSEEDRGSAP